MTYYDVLQFYLPKRAYKAIDTATIRAKARAACLPKDSFEYSEYRTPPTQGRVTCHWTLVSLFVEALAEVSARAEGQLVIDCAAGGRNALAALQNMEREAKQSGADRPPFQP